MKKIIIILFLLLAPVSVFGAIDQNLYYGMARNDKVKELQNFLIGKGFMPGNATGNFYSLTLSAVKKYQASKSIITTGYVGPLTRAAINSDLPSSEQNAAGTDVAQNNQTAPASLTGSFDLLQNPDYSNQAVTAPQSKFKLADFVLTNNTNDNVNLKTLQVDLATDSDLYVTNLYLNNLYVVYGQKVTGTKATVSHNNYWSVDIQLQPGQKINLMVYGDVNSSIPLNSTINSSLLVSAVSASSKANIYTNSNTPLAGQAITFGSNFLTAEQDSSASLSRIVVANQSVVAGKFKFTSSKDSYIISELKFIVPNYAASSIISGAVLLDSETQAALTLSPVSLIYSGGNYIIVFSNLNISIGLNSSRYIAVSYNLGSVISPENTNKNIAPILAYVKAKDGKGNFLDSSVPEYNFFGQYGGITLPAGGIAANNLYVFKSVPTFSSQSLSSATPLGDNIELSSFKVSADPKGDISIKQIQFSISISSATNSYPYLKNFSLYKGDANYAGSVAICSNSNNRCLGLDNNVIGVGTSNVTVIFDKEETIPAGTTNIYTLRARISNGPASINVSIPTDSAPSSNGSYLRSIFSPIYGLSTTPTGINVSVYNVLWSDKSAINFPMHSYTNGFSTKDWYNGFGVLGLPL